MKKVITIIFTLGFVSIAALVPTSSIEARGYGMAGCGVGALLFQDKPGKIQILAATTNQAFYQSSSITSGTSACSEDGILKASIEQEVYIAANIEVLRLDIAKGQGDSLNSLAFLMGCSKGMTPLFGTVSKKNYDKIFLKDDDNNSDWVHYRMKEMIRANSSLIASCSKVAN